VLLAVRCQRDEVREKKKREGRVAGQHLNYYAAVVATLRSTGVSLMDLFSQSIPLLPYASTQLYFLINIPKAKPHIFIQPLPSPAIESARK
jgi:hypothetical protein